MCASEAMTSRAIPAHGIEEQQEEGVEEIGNAETGAHPIEPVVGRERAMSEPSEVYSGPLESLLRQGSEPLDDLVSVGSSAGQNRAVSTDSSIVLGPSCKWISRPPPRGSRVPPPTTGELQAISTEAFQRIKRLHQSLMNDARVLKQNNVIPVGDRQYQPRYGRRSRAPTPENLREPVSLRARDNSNWNEIESTPNQTRNEEIPDFGNVLRDMLPVE